MDELRFKASIQVKPYYAVSKGQTHRPCKAVAEVRTLRVEAASEMNTEQVWKATEIHWPANDHGRAIPPSGL